MDSGTIIIGSISIAICVLPFVLLRKNRKKIEKQFLQSLNELATRQHGKITKHEFCGELVIGLDEANNSVFLFKKNKDKETAQYVSLAEMLSCKVINTSTAVADRRVIDRLDLCFVPVAKDKPDVLLEIYNAHENMHLMGEIQFIEKWAKIINDQLSDKKR